LQPAGKDCFRDAHNDPDAVALRHVLDLFALRCFHLAIHHSTEGNAMAKKKAAASFKMAEEIRALLSDNRKLSAPEVLKALQAKHPDTPINEKSFSVAFYGARKKLGIASERGGGKKVVRKKLPSAGRPKVDLGALQAAARFLAEAGSTETAIEAIRQVQGLQIK
jgi:hypothetical protein